MKELSEKDRQMLLSYRKQADENDIRYKEIIKQKLLKNFRILYLIHNEELWANLEEDGTGADKYFDTHIKPIYIFPDTQSHTSVYLCYETSFDEVSRYNSLIKTQEIIFYILAEEKDCVVKDLGIARHDAIAAEIINEFNGCNDFGNQLKLVSNKPSVTDSHYSTRTLIFEQLTPNSPTQYGKTSFNLRK